METKTVDASVVLDGDLFMRDAMFLELERERGKPVSYRTFWNWCQILGISPGEPSYTAEDVLILKTYCWLRSVRKLRNVDRNTVLSQIKEYTNARLRYCQDSQE